MGRTALWWAAVQGDEEVVKLLLEMGKADVNAADSDGATPLWRAAHDGHGTVVKLLLEDRTNQLTTAAHPF
ncbi:Heterokaryon incompatibility protein 6, OR allele [Fusarium oxysporum f. sp. albedinis]|nr:Heterokaryon incompatibility protein 6, OR allele [Fusarium oxysporum f. sp. albedinis]